MQCRMKDSYFPEGTLPSTNMEMDVTHVQSCFASLPQNRLAHVFIDKIAPHRHFITIQVISNVKNMFDDLWLED